MLSKYIKEILINERSFLVKNSLVIFKLFNDNERLHHTYNVRCTVAWIINSSLQVNFNNIFININVHNVQSTLINKPD